MQVLLIESAKLLSFTALASRIQELTKKFLENSTNENLKNEIDFMCAMWTTKSVLESKYDGNSSKMNDEFDSFKKREEIFNPNKN